MDATLVINGIECPLSVLEFKEKSTVVIRCPEGIKDHDFAVFLKPLIAKYPSVMFVGLRAGTTMEEVDEAAMNHAGWFRTSLDRPKVHSALTKAYNKVHKRFSGIHIPTDPAQVIKDLGRELLGQWECEVKT